MPANASVMVLSDGRSMFKNTMHVPVQTSADKPFDDNKFQQILEDKELMRQMRSYVLMLNHHSDVTLADFNIPSEVSEYAQNIFIEVRRQEQEQNGTVSTNADTLHLWLTMSRLLAISEGNLTLTKETYERVRLLE